MFNLFEGRSVGTNIRGDEYAPSTLYKFPMIATWTFRVLFKFVVQNSRMKNLWVRGWACEAMFNRRRLGIG